MPLPVAFGSYDKDPETYFIREKGGLWKAVEIALQLGRPLLLTGEPGTGKTQLAHYAAWRLSQENYTIPFLNRPFVFHSKTTSVAKDLFYNYDAIGHFQNKTGRDVKSFINLTAMGQAIVQSIGRYKAGEVYNLDSINNLELIDKEPKSVVVLIDEIDKASRDFPNDMLNEIENNEFYISEIDRIIKANKDENARVLVIFTSNNEKSLPDAFLRRCVFYNIEFPGKVDLLQILVNKLTPFLQQQKIQIQASELESKYNHALDFYLKTRGSMVQKPPATSELIDWIKILHLEGVFDKHIDFNNLKEPQHSIVKMSLYTLFKSVRDVEHVQKEFLASAL